MNNFTSVALFIDLENVMTSMWKLYQQPADVFGWVDKVRKYGTIAFGRAYGDFNQNSLANVEADLRARNIDKFDCPIKPNGQSTVDSNIIIDLYEVALDQPNVKTFVLMAGDSDYIRVVAKLRQRMDKDIVIMGVRGSISRELVRAAGKEDPLDPVIAAEAEESGVIKLIDDFESSRRMGTLPTFGYLRDYVSNERNRAIINPATVHAKLNEFVARGVLAQEIVALDDGREIRVTRLDRTNPIVIEALKKA